MRTRNVTLTILVLGAAIGPLAAQEPHFPRQAWHAALFASQRVGRPSWPSIQVEFQGKSVCIQCPCDVSNVVLQYDDGSRQRYEDLQGKSLCVRGTGSNAGKTIVACWIKAGPNLSGDGPGYGQRFVAPNKTAAKPRATATLASRSNRPPAPAPPR